MKANYKIEAGDVRVIRPLIYVREHMTRDFSQTSKLPIINENCPACFEQPKVRSILVSNMSPPCSRIVKVVLTCLIQLPRLTGERPHEEADGAGGEAPRP